MQRDGFTAVPSKRNVSSRENELTTTVIWLLIGLAFVAVGIYAYRFVMAGRKIEQRMAEQKREEAARRERLVAQQRTRPSRTISSGAPVTYSGTTIRPAVPKKASAPKPRKSSSDDTTYGYVAPDYSSWGSNDSSSNYSGGFTPTADSSSSSSGDTGSSSCD
jgi:hypothetical protein